jgi:hypothetical protein
LCGGVLGLRQIVRTQGRTYAERPARRHVRRWALYFVSKSFSVAAMITRWHWTQARWMRFLSDETGYVLDHEARLIGAVRAEG